MTKREIFFEFTAYVNRNYQSDCTRKIYNSYCKKFLSEEHKESVKNLSKDYLQSYLDNKLKLHSISVYNQYLSVLKILYSEVLGSKYKLSNIKPLKQNRKLKILPNINDLIDKSSRVKNIKHRAILLTLISTGARSSELLNIKLSDIKRNTTSILIQSGKGDKSRFVDLNETLLQILEDYYRKEKPKVYLFENPKGGKYSSTSLYNIVKKHLGGNPHLCRHSYTTYMINNKVNSEKLRNMLGHESEKTLKWYYQYTPEFVEKEINPLNLIQLNAQN